jgi:hypothetical protein
MASIKDCSSKRPLKQQLKGVGRLREDSKTSGAAQSTGKENQVPVILAKSAVAVKMQIVTGMGNGVKAMPRPEGPSASVEGSGGLSMNQKRFNEDTMIQNLKGIVADDGRWDLFALGALGLQPGTEACNTLKCCLQKGFNEDTWDGIVNLVALHSVNTSSDRNAGTCALTDDLSAGLIERTKLWLTFTDYFETLFSAVREKRLSNNIDLYTDERLIQYLDTIGQ